MDHNGKNKREIGYIYEKRAIEFLEKKGYQIIEKNYYTRYGEIDIIAHDQEYLVFIEVKYRSNAYNGAALEAVFLKKQHRIIMSAKEYLYQNKYREECTPCRFDVIAFEKEKMFHIIDAFQE